MTAYFQAAVSDPKERELARKDSREEITYWRKQGIRYLYARKIENYEEEMRLYGEIESEPWPAISFFAPKGNTLLRRRKDP